eukprot:scaffold2062_cov181-Ochromonas_danica.AAC.7
MSVGSSNMFPSMIDPMGRDMFMYDNYFGDRIESMVDASRTLFLGDLSYFCTEEDLCTLFADYGPILTVRVRRGVTGESLMHGFIALESPDMARRAITDLDGIEFMGRNMRVQLSSDGQRPGPGAKEKFVQVHVSFISKQISMVITEKVLREIFSPFGRIADVAIKKHTSVPKQHRQSGYGFVYFYEADSAYRALHALKHSTVRDITLDCSISHKSEHMIKQQMRYRPDNHYSMLPHHGGGQVFPQHNGMQVSGAAQLSSVPPVPSYAQDGYGIYHHNVPARPQPLSIPTSSYQVHPPQPGGDHYYGRSDHNSSYGRSADNTSPTYLTSVGTSRSMGSTVASYTSSNNTTPRMAGMNNVNVPNTSVNRNKVQEVNAYPNMLTGLISAKSVDPVYVSSDSNNAAFGVGSRSSSFWDNRDDYTETAPRLRSLMKQDSDMTERLYDSRSSSIFDLSAFHSSLPTNSLPPKGSMDDNSFLKCGDHSSEVGTPNLSYLLGDQLPFNKQTMNGSGHTQLQRSALQAGDFTDNLDSQMPANNMNWPSY